MSPYTFSDAWWAVGFSRLRGDEPCDGAAFHIGAGVPRVRGDEPWTVRPSYQWITGSPACAGMSRSGWRLGFYGSRFPRVRGDEPFANDDVKLWK